MVEHVSLLFLYGLIIGDDRHSYLFATQAQQDILFIRVSAVSFIF